jgi:hypothetical protein
MFPQANYSPTLTSQRFRDLLIPGHVALDLSHPPLCPTGKEFSQILPATPPDFFRVAMPHVAINEHCQAPGPDDQIRAARQVSGVKAITKPGGVQCPAQAQLGLGILVADSSHHPAGDGRVARAESPAALSRHD